MDVQPALANPETEEYLAMLDTADPTMRPYMSLYPPGLDLLFKDLDVRETLHLSP